MVEEVGTGGSISGSLWDKTPDWTVVANRLLEMVLSGNADEPEYVAVGAVNAICQYVENEDFDRMEMSGSRLLDLSNQHSNQAHYQDSFAYGLNNLMHSYAETKRFDRMNWWGDKFDQLAMHNQDNKEVQKRFAIAAMGAIEALVKQGKYVEGKLWCERLWRTMNSNLGDHGIQLAFVTATYFVITNHNFFGEYIDSWVRLFGDVSDSEIPHPTVDSSLAYAAYNVIVFYLASNKPAEAQKWQMRLACIAERYPENQQILGMIRDLIAWANAR